MSRTYHARPPRHPKTKEFYSLMDDPKPPRCERDELRKCRKEHIRKDEFDPANENHFRLQSRGGAWRYYRKVD